MISDIILVVVRPSVLILIHQLVVNDFLNETFVKGKMAHVTLLAVQFLAGKVSRV